MSSLLVLGLGNVICGDDGVGIAAIVELMRRYRPARGVKVLDGGTLGLSLLPELQSADAAILVDAIRDGDSPPGTLVRLEQEEVARAASTRLSVHQVSVANLLDGVSLLGRCPPRLVLCGVVPENTDLRVGLMPSVAASLPALIDSVLREAATLGKPFRESRHVAGGLGDDRHRLLGL